MSNRYPHDHDADINYFAQTNFRNALRKFGLKTLDRRQHVYMVGKTGVGKTTALENMFLADVYAGHGCCFLDPHGDTAERLIDFIPSWRINDVVYFNPSDVEHPIGFNILESIDPKMKSLVVSALMSIFKKIWENVWSARMEYILNNTLLALLDTPGTTLLGVNRMLSDRDYRVEIIKNIQDPIVKQFWLQEFASYDAKFATEAVAPIQNKVGQFLSSSIMRNIVAQAKSSINIRDIMDHQKIFIINLSKGRVGEDAMRLLGGLLVTKMQVAAMERVDTPENEREDFYLYVDEFQNFASESFAGILSEARKYRLNLILAHQYIAQLSEEVRDAVFGNIGTLLSFRVGSADAEYMESEFAPRFLPEDLINLPRFGIYVKLMIDGVTSQPFSAVSLPPLGQPTGSAPKIIEQSRERYTGNRAQIEEHVAVWSGFGQDVDIEGKLKEARDAKDAAKKLRYSQEYFCTRCNKSIMLPVELDRSRPIFCDDCRPFAKDFEAATVIARKEPKATEEAISKTPSATTASPVFARSLNEVKATKQSPNEPTSSPRPPQHQQKRKHPEHKKKHQHQQKQQQRRNDHPRKPTPNVAPMKGKIIPSPIAAGTMTLAQLAQESALHEERAAAHAAKHAAQPDPWEAPAAPRPLRPMERATFPDDADGV